MYHCGFHGNLVTIALMYVAKVFGPKEGSLTPNINPVSLKTNELMRYYCGCHGNLVTMARKYVAHAYYPEEG